MKMALQRGMALPEGGQRRLWDDGLKKCGDELAQQAPCAEPGQAASCTRGESSNASTSGSSNKIMSR